MNIVIKDSAKDGFWEIVEDRKLVKRLKQLTDDIDRHPFTGIGKPEPLRGRPGQWSRRIDEYQRLIYKIENDEIRVLECGGHYEG